jgi:hypothetical protein
VSLCKVNELRFQWTQLTGKRKWTDYKDACNDWGQLAFPYNESILHPTHFTSEITLKAEALCSSKTSHTNFYPT